METAVAMVALQGATSAFDRFYTYVIPPDLLSKATPGKRVRQRKY